MALPRHVPPPAVVSIFADQLCIDPAVFRLYAQRKETRREHAREIVAALDLQPVGERLSHAGHRGCA
ncbi:DUF4158 domain-containing protein [Ensifer sp. SSB1]|uniref:DUF4158 domain-containing protein n=1 Tax=Ensifer sp. SSB1 TaxID=2795385 RepID=UPI001A5EB9C6|nr:DUF4158 domain-containing protein [Ensifer sp. SSB1]MBK5571203.1 DUF4158 domain-containing protein [Ensifer sp. SSB1]